MAGQTVAATEIASTIGLIEETFQEKGGGLWWVLIIVTGSAILTYAALIEREAAVAFAIFRWGKPFQQKPTYQRNNIRCRTTTDSEY
jgi:hypothetical protein